jgi:hypothetical protein
VSGYHFMTWGGISMLMLGYCWAARARSRFAVDWSMPKYKAIRLPDDAFSRQPVEMTEWP